MSRPKPSSRANGRLSSGPKTAEGKARSSRNALRHGLLSRDPILTDESAAGYSQLLAQYRSRFRPQNPGQADLVDAMVHARWQLLRLRALENGLFNDHMLDSERSPQPDAAPQDDSDRLAVAFSELLADGSYPLLQRYEARLQNVFQRALETLVESRAAAPPTVARACPAPPSPLKNTKITKRT